MSSLPFTLRQLEIFANLCASDSFGHSAESLGISQASISSQIKALEDQLGFALFQRRPGRPSILTLEGKNFRNDLHAFEVAAYTLAGHRNLIKSVESSITYRVRAGQGLFDNFIRARLGEFLASHPNIEFEFDISPPTYRISGEVIGGKFDFALFHIRQDQQIPPKVQPIASVCGGIYGHRDFAKGRTLPLTEDYISSLPFILPLAGSPQEKEVLELFGRIGISPREVVCHTPYFDVMATLLDSGVGVASFTDAILPVAMRANVLMLCPLIDWSLVWFRKDPTPDPRADAVQEFLRSCVLDHPDYPKIGSVRPNAPS